MASWQSSIWHGIVWIFSRIIRLRERIWGMPSMQYMRNRIRKGAATYPVPRGIQYHDGNLGRLKALWIKPLNLKEESRIGLYLHGGGYTLCDRYTHKSMVGKLAKEAGIQMVIPEYGLAPEHQFPSGLNDCYHAYESLLELGYQPRHIFIGGDSAGGGLTLGVLQMIRSASMQMPAAAFCISPWANLFCNSDDMEERYKKDPMIDPLKLRMMAEFYAKPSDFGNPLVSPIFADFSGFPPLQIMVGSYEVLLDDAEKVAENARNHGVQVHFKSWKKQIHVWTYYWVILPEARQALREIGDFIKSHKTTIELEGKNWLGKRK